MKSLTKIAILAGAAGGIVYTAAKKKIPQISIQDVKQAAHNLSDKIREEISSSEEAVKVINKTQEMGKELKDSVEQIVKHGISPNEEIASSIDDFKEALSEKLSELKAVPELSADWAKLLTSYNNAVENSDSEKMPRIGSLDLSNEELNSQFTLCAFLNSPLNVQSDVDSFDDEKLKDLFSIASNEDIIKIKEDILNIGAVRIKCDSLEDILLKPLDNDEFAICMFNKTNEPRIMELNLQAAVSNAFIKTPKSESYEVFDLSTKESFPIKDDLLKYVLPHGTRAFRVKALA